MLINAPKNISKAIKKLTVRYHVNGVLETVK